MSMIIDSENDGHFNLRNTLNSKLISTNNHSNKNNQLDFFNNSLLNVSMVDDINVADNLDFNSSSILTF